jgi:glucose/mannose-6-phosphate isomerase
MDESAIKAIDSQDMWGKVCSFPEQWQDAHDLASELEFSIDKDRIRNICISGMGGSAIGGDLLKGYMISTCRIPLIINRQYKLPGWIGTGTLFIACSYSGDTEETLEAVESARLAGAQIVCLTSGGKLLEMAYEYDLDYIRIPSGYTPRAALAYTFVPLYKLFIEIGLIPDDPALCASMPEFLAEQVEVFSNLDENEPMMIAGEIRDTLPIIYTNSDYLEPVNVRWRSQFAENAKILSYGNLLPEMSHNEIVGWEQMAHLTGRLSVFMLQDADDHPRVKLRMDITRELIRDHVVGMHMVATNGPNRLAKMFYMVQYGDFLSLYYAFLNGTDPTPVTKIELLKSRLSELQSGNT